MCNHYRKGQKREGRDEVIEWTQRVIPSAVPTPLPEFAEHIFPKYPAPVVVQISGERTLVTKTWGIAMPIKGATKTLTRYVTNARNDKLSSFTWNQSTRHRRCLIPATGYFEPGTGPTGARGEILFTVKERPAFFFAGLWDGTEFTMVTTEPNDFVRRYHDRMPVVLSDSDAVAWLGDEPLAISDVQALCRGLPSEALNHEELPPKLKITKTGTKPPRDDEPTLF